ncbi:MAG: hypothetical protein AABX39_00260 [Nanoarchaeota archaeon]
MNVLIACPTYDGQKYCVERFIERAGAIKNYKIMFFDNSLTKDYSEFLRSKEFEVVNVDCGDKKGNERIAECMKFICKYFLEGKFDYLFCLETDVLVPEKIVETLLSRNKDIVGGIYLTEYNVTHVKKDGSKYSEWERHPVADVYSPKMNYLRPLPMEAAKKNILARVATIGLGCTLIKRNVLEKTEFRYRENWSHDALFCLDAQQNGFTVFVDTSIKCVHVKEDKEMDWSI